MRLKGFVLAGILLLLLSNDSFSQVQTARNTSMTPNSTGYYEYLPQGYNSGNQNYPLILYIHGMGELDPAPPLPPWPLSVILGGLPGLINQGRFPASFTVNGQTSSFIVISPKFILWPLNTDIQDILDYVVQHYRIDQTRIYMTGLSMGGGVTWDYASGNSTYANRLAAIVPIAGASWPDFSRGRVIAAANLPVWATHNSDDPTVPVSYTNDYITNINTAPAPTPLAKKTIFPVSGHDAWTKTYDPAWKEDGVMNIYQWMLQYTRSTAGPNPNQAPASNAGISQTISLPTSVVTLTGSGSDADGTIVSYAWTQINGTAATISSPSSPSTTITGLTTTGSRLFGLTVTDDKGATGTSYVMITVNPVPKAIPGRIEEENWDAKSGPQYAVATTDSGGGQKVVGIVNGSWMDYNVNVVSTGIYAVSFRIATTRGNSQFQLKSGTTVIGTVNIPSSGDWNNWVTVPFNNIPLTAGVQTIRILSTNNDNCDVNWMEWALSAPNTAPTANAGSNQTITLPASQVTLTGGGTAGNGGTITYAWSQVSGTAAAITTPSAASTTVTGLTTPGVRIFRLTVTQSDNQTVTSNVTITVNPVTPPTANAGTNQTITLPASQVTLTGSSTVGNGGTITYAWTQVSGTAAAITTPAVASTTVTGLTTSGIRVFRLTVTQSDNQTITSDVTITVNPVNVSTAYGGTRRTIPGKLEAEDYDNGGQNTAYYDGTTANSGGAYRPAESVDVRTCPDAGGGYCVGWTTDGEWLKYSVNVTTTGAYIFTARIGSPNTGKSIQLQVDGATMGTLTVLNTGGYNNWQTATLNNVSLTAGDHIFRFLFNTGDAANTDMGFDINWFNFALAPSLLPSADAGLTQTITLPASQVTLTGSGTAGNGGTITYAWTQVNGIAATITTPSAASTTVTGLTTSGIKIFRLTVTQNDNQTATSDVTITVNPAQPPPLANAGSNQTIILPASQVTLTGTGTAGNGGTITYTWTQVSGTVAAITTPSAASTTVTGLTTSGIRIFRLTVTQGDNQTATSDVTITVNPAPSPPVANAGSPQTITLPVSQVTLTGSGTAGNGGTIAYAWTQVSGTAGIITTPSAASTTVTGLTTSGIRVFRLTVTQSGNQTATSDITITVNAANTSTPYSGTRKSIPGKLEAEEYDNGGQNIAYFDGTTVNSGGAFRPAESVDVRTCPDAGGGYCIGWTTDGEWVKYSVNVTTTGAYIFTARIGSPNTGKSIQLQVDGATVGTLTILNTGGYDNWQTTTLNNVQLTAGDHVFRFLFNTGDAANTNMGFDINWFNFALSPTQSPSADAGSPQTLILPVSQVTLTGSGTANNGGTITYAWTMVSGPNAAPALSIVSPTVSSTLVTGLVQGVYVFRLTITRNDNQTATSDVTISVNPASNGKTIPGKIEAESFDAKSGGMYAVATTDAGGGMKVIGITNAGWMDYNVNVASTGIYTVSFRIATTRGNSQFQLKSGSTIIGTVNIPSTGDWNNWVTVPFNNISLTAGIQTIRILSTNNDNCDINWMDFALSSQAAASIVSVTRTVPVNDQSTLPVVEPITSSSIAIFPNPVQDQFVLRSNNNHEGAMRIQIINANGRMMKEIQAAKNKGRSEIYFSATGMAPGTYIIRVQMGEWTQSIKMIKQ